MTDPDPIAEVWPDGLSVDDRLIWNLLSPSEKKEAIKRLKALLLARPLDGTVEPMSVARAAELAGVSRRTMYNIVSAWSQPRGRGRTIASLGFRPRKLSNDGPKNWADVEKKVRSYVSRRLARNPGMRTEALISALGELGLDPLPSRMTLYRWITDVKRDRAVGAEFGRRIRIDRVMIEATDLAGLRHFVFAVIDVGSRLVLGWRRVDERSSAAPRELTEAADQAVAFLRSTDLGGLPASDRDPKVEFILTGDTVGDLRNVARFGSAFETDERKFGRATIRALGERVGPYRLAAGENVGHVIARSRDETEFPSIDAEDMERVLAEAFASHNQTVFDRYPGHMSEALVHARDKVVAGLSARDQAR